MSVTNLGNNSDLFGNVPTGGGGGGVTSVGVSTPLTKSGSATSPTIAIPAATTSTPGHMTSAQVLALNAKLDAPVAPNAVTGARTLVAADNGATLYNNTTNAYVITVPTGLPAGFSVQLVQKSTGVLSVLAGASTTVTSPDSFTKTGGANKSIVIYNSGIANDYIIGGQGAV